MDNIAEDEELGVVLVVGGDGNGRGGEKQRPGQVLLLPYPNTAWRPK